MTAIIGPGGLPIPQNVPLPKQELKDIGGDELAQAAHQTDTTNFLMGLMGKREIKRSNIVADSDTIRVTRLNGRLTFRHLHPQDPPTIMVNDPEARGGYLCPSCGDEADSATCKILADDVKIEESATAYYEAEEKEYQDTPVVAVGSKVTETKVTLRFLLQTPEAIKECIGKLAGMDHKITGYVVVEKPLSELGLPVVDDSLKAQDVTIYFEDQNALFRFAQDKKAKKAHERFIESDAFKKLMSEIQK